MFCPLLPGIADLQEQVDELVRFAVSINAEEIFVEPVNSRGPGLRLCQNALEEAGYYEAAGAIGHIRKRPHWSEYVANLVRTVQSSVRRLSDIRNLRFLLYPSGLLEADRRRIEQDDEGVVWL